MCVCVCVCVYLSDVAVRIVTSFTMKQGFLPLGSARAGEHLFLSPWLVCTGLRLCLSVQKFVLVSFCVVELQHAPSRH